MILTISLLSVHIDIEITCNLRRKVLYEIDWRSWVWDTMPAVLAFLGAKPRNWHYFIWMTRLIPSKDLKVNEFHIIFNDFKLLNSKLLSRFGDMFLTYLFTNHIIKRYLDWKISRDRSRSTCNSPILWLMYLHLLCIPTAEHNHQIRQTIESPHISAKYRQDGFSISWIVKIFHLFTMML
jgi:hypothetical protein